MYLYKTRWLILFIACILSWQCKSTINSAISVEKEPEWEAIPEFMNLSISSIVKYEGTLFVSGKDINTRKGSIYFSTDANNWVLLKVFNKPVGPMTINADTLFCISDSLYRYIIPIQKFETICRSQPICQDPEAIGDMVVINNKLFAMQSKFTDAVTTYLVNYDGNRNPYGLS